MPCLISAGISTIPCRDNIPGISKFYIANYQDVTEVTNVDQEVTAVTMSGSTVFYEFNVNPQSSSYSAAPTTDVANGVTTWTPTITAVFGKVDSSKSNLMKLLSTGNFVVIALDRNNNAWLFGKTVASDTGVYVSGGEIASGTSGTDLSGISIEISGEQLYPPPLVDPTVLADIIE